MPDRVVVRVPATVANLGPGFDCLGLAIAWHNIVTVERADTLSITMDGATGLAADATNLVARGVAEVLGTDAVRIHQDVNIALGRGLGSSAAAIVAGVVAGAALNGEKAGERGLAIATSLEGHPDNVAPCLLGGITVSAAGRTVRLDPPKRLRVLTCVAASGMPTKAARAALPDRVSRRHAVENLGRTSLLTAALATGSTDLLMEATDDRLHQPARFKLMPESAAAVAGLRGAGIAAFLSGAGPSVAAFVSAEAADRATESARALVPGGWQVRLHDIDAAGATVLETS